MELVEFCEKLSRRKLDQAEKQLLNAVENNRDCFVAYPMHMGYLATKRIGSMFKIIIGDVLK